jgi:DNA-binding response OmpR family regulator
MLYQTLDKTTLTVDGFALDLSKTSLHKGNKKIHLTPKECKLLALLMQNAGKVVSRKKLMEQVWETNYMGDTRTLDVHICWLRQKVEDNPRNPRYIVTKRGEGYILKV